MRAPLRSNRACQWPPSAASPSPAERNNPCGVNSGWKPGSACGEACKQARGRNSASMVCIADGFAFVISMLAKLSCSEECHALPTIAPILKELRGTSGCRRAGATVTTTCVRFVPTTRPARAQAVACDTVGHPQRVIRGANSPWTSAERQELNGHGLVLRLLFLTQRSLATESSPTRTR